MLVAEIWRVLRDRVTGGQELENRVVSFPFSIYPAVGKTSYKRNCRGGICRATDTNPGEKG